jgi:biopolymer transport protein ExbD
MDFTPARRARQTGENIVPMINVVFLLLIFFLMTAQIAPPVPFEVSPPASGESTASPDAFVTLHVSREGALYFNGATGDAVWNEIQPDASILIRADAGFAASELARILSRLTALGVTEIALVAERAP